jgi:hypothetical protein
VFLVQHLESGGMRQLQGNFNRRHPAVPVASLFAYAHGKRLGALQQTRLRSRKSQAMGLAPKAEAAFAVISLRAGGGSATIWGRRAQGRDTGQRCSQARVSPKIIPDMAA